MLNFNNFTKKINNLTHEKTPTINNIILFDQFVSTKQGSRKSVGIAELKSQL